MCGFLPFLLGSNSVQKQPLQTHGNPDVQRTLLHSLHETQRCQTGWYGPGETDRAQDPSEGGTERSRIEALHDFGFILGLCLSFCREGVAVPAARNGNGSTGLWWRRVVVKVNY